MFVQHMTNNNGFLTANNYVIQDNSGNMFMQSYNEIVAIKVDGIVYFKESGLERSKSTKRYMLLFADRYGNSEYTVISDEEFLDKEGKL